MNALLPLRLFFGATFLWAGLDKLLDPAFLDASAPTSLHAQLLAFARTSPLGEVIEHSLPFAPLIGLGIAVGEIGIGIGALTGLAFRVAAFGGAAISLLFWLTVSWGTHPYYLGPDLPYMFGWIALLIAGPGDRFLPARYREPLPTPPQDAGFSPERRLLLQTGTLAAVAAIVASIALPLRAIGLITGQGARGGPGSSESPGPQPGPSQPTTSIPPDAVAVAKMADVTAAGWAAFTIPFDAPAPLPAGDPGVIVQLADGTFVAFDAVCTHAGCTVEWDRSNKVLLCPCHDAVFDAAHGAVVLDGPAPTPLTNLPIAIDAATGTILLVPSA